MAYDAEARRRLLLVLEREKNAEERAQAATELCELAATSGDAKRLFVEDIPRLIADRQIAVQRCGLALATTVLPLAEATELLGSKLADPSEQIRTEAAGRLADLGGERMRAMLAPSLEDPVLAVRFEAARGMAALQHASGLDVLVEALDRDDYRFRALGALGELGIPRALPAVQRVFRKWLLPAFERTQAAGVMVRLGDHTGEEHLLKVAGGRWSTDRALALELCGEVKVAGAFEQLDRVARNPKDESRGAAARGLGRLADPRGLATLSALLEEGGAPEDVQLDAAEGLCLLGTPEALSRARQAAERLTGEARRELELMLAEPAGAEPPK